MIFVDIEKRLKYDTTKMELVSKKVKIRSHNGLLTPGILVPGELYRSKKENWLAIENYKDGTSAAFPVDEKESQNMLLRYDVNKYEEIFGKLEEA